MANEAMETFLGNQKQEDEECPENVPPASVLGETSPATPPLMYDKDNPPLHSALTPILKYLNIGNKCSSSLSTISFNNDAGKLKSSPSVLSLKDKSNSVWNETLPEISLLDETCDLTVNMTRYNHCDSAPSTPGFTKDMKKYLRNMDPNPNSSKPIHWIHDEVLEMTQFDDTMDSTTHLERRGSVQSDAAPGTPVCETERPEMPAEDTVKNEPKPAPKSDDVPEMGTSSSETSHEQVSLETGENVLLKTSKLEEMQCSLEKTLTGNLTHSISSASGVSGSFVADVQKVQLQVTQDISMSSTLENSTSLSENGSHKIPVNVTCDISASNTSVTCEGASTSKNITTELQVEPVKVPAGEEQGFTLGKEENNQINARSLNGTFTTVQRRSDSTAQAFVNRTRDLPMSQSRTDVSPESSLLLNDNESGSKSSKDGAVQNQTIENDSPKKSSGSLILVQPAATMTSLQNTFENKPNGTLTCTETSAVADVQQFTIEMSSSSAAKTLSTAEPNPPEPLVENMDTNTGDKLAEPHEGTFNVNEAAKETSASGSKERDSLNNSLCIHPCFVALSQKANISSLNQTLDFESVHLLTSTPMTSTKPFNFTVEGEESNVAAAQRKLYGEGPNKLTPQAAADIPSNIVSDRKTFLRQPHNLPNMKPPSRMFKPGSIPTLSRPMKANTAHVLQQTRVLSSTYNLRSTAAAALGVKPSVSSLRKPSASSVTSSLQRAGHGLKPPQAKVAHSALSGADKPAGGPHPVAKTSSSPRKHPLPKTDVMPAAKKKKMDLSSNTSAASSSDSKANNLKPPTQNQRTLPAKPPKHYAASTATAICEPSSRVQTLKAPAGSLRAPSTKPHKGCSNCALHKEQLRLITEENKLLKEELLKWREKDHPK
ncbi:unnamed protein product [Knipowitschia caucasica]